MTWISQNAPSRRAATIWGQDARETSRERRRVARHTIFGEVADEESRKVVDEIAQVRTGRMDRPVEPVVIESVELA